MTVTQSAVADRAGKLYQRSTFPGSARIPFLIPFPVARWLELYSRVWWNEIILSRARYYARQEFNREARGFLTEGELRLAPRHSANHRPLPGGRLNPLSSDSIRPLCRSDYWPGSSVAEATKDLPRRASNTCVRLPLLP